MAGLLNRQDDRFGILHEPTPGSSQSGACPIADEQLGAQLRFQILDARADRRLGHVNPLGGLEETAVCGDGEKCPGLIDVQIGALLYLISSYTIRIADKFRLSKSWLHQYDALQVTKTKENRT